MMNFSFDRVNLMLVDPGHGFRRSLRHGLGRLGFASVQDVPRLSQLTSVLDDEKPDLLICDVGLPDGDVCEVVRAIRHSELGHNPFLSVITMTHEPTAPTVRKVVDSGSDHLLVKPVSPLQVFERIGQLVSHRKPFVVTAAYIGPDRRRSRDRPATVPLFPVPNTLRAKVTGSQHPKQIEKAIERSIGVLNREKMRRDADRIRDLAERVIATGEDGAAVGRRLVLLDDLVIEASDIERRAKGTDLAHAGELARTLVLLVERLRRHAEAPDPTDQQLLRPVAQAIELSVSPERGDATIAHDISAIVGSERPATVH